MFQNRASRLEIHTNAAGGDAEDDEDEVGIWVSSRVVAPKLPPRVVNSSADSVLIAARTRAIKVSRPVADMILFLFLRNLGNSTKYAFKTAISSTLLET